MTLSSIRVPKDWSCNIINERPAAGPLQDRRTTTGSVLHYLFRQHPLPDPAVRSCNIINVRTAAGPLQDHRTTTGSVLHYFCLLL